MKKISKKILIIIIACVVLLCGGIAGLIYKINYKQTAIKTSYYSDNAYELTIYEIGEPDFPFGSSHCRFVLLDGEKEISSTDFEVQNDGKNLNDSNFDISWSNKGAKIIVNGEEQEDTVYYINFDGKTETVAGAQ